ncbi:MAG: hypothetical protein PHD91_00080 [bacterium]|jgi:hypothetical protein|nr:hypothetical protein [bacterium]MDD3804774.1 hypothetical protein [bacterium]MDD4152103.1 hypothetical protein [bacterium]MDD4557592.1 hypothetical protein [bacterium]
MPRKIWTRSIIAAEIKRLHEIGQDLSWTSMRQEYGYLLAAAGRYFGGWQEAIEFIGLDYSTIRRVASWDADKIVRKIKELYKQGHDLSLRNMVADRELSRITYAASRHFESWKNAIEEAGLDYDAIARQKTWSQSEIEETILQLHRAGEDLSSKQMDISHQPLISAARKRFGTWEKAINHVGLDYDKIRKREHWTRDKILNKIKALHEDGESLRSTYILKRYPALYAATQKKRYFGGWINAVRAAGIEYNSRKVPKMTRLQLDQFIKKQRLDKKRVAAVK